MAGTATTSPDLISMPEIAELARVRRPVVTTWRRRYPGFPAPIGGDPSRPLFDAGQIVDWLVETGRADRRSIEPDLRLHMLACLASPIRLPDQASSGSRSIGARPRPMRSRELTAAITALICLRHLDDEPLHQPGETGRHAIADLRDRARDADPDDELLRAEIEALPSGTAWLAAAVDELVEAAWGCPRAYERVLAARHRLAVPDLYVDAITPALARLIAGLSGAREHAERAGTVRVADPSARVGDLLMAVRDQLGEDAAPVFVAAEPDPFLARVARRRLAVHGIPPSERRISIGVELPAGRAADVLVTRLPYQSTEERAGTDPLAAMRTVVDRLAAGQTAVVLGPADLLAGALPPYRAAARTRNELLASGTVEAVIRLPGGLVAFRPGYQTALWVLRREEPSRWRGRVLLADVADRPLTDDLVGTLIWDVTTWRRDGYQPDQHLRAHASQVAVAELIAPRRPLTTRPPAGLRELDRDPRHTIARLVDLEAELAMLTRPDTEPLHTNAAARPEHAPLPTQPISALVKAEQFVMAKGHRIAPDDIVHGGHHRVLGAPELTGHAPVGRRGVDRGVLAARYPRVRLTEPDDVVVTLAPAFGVHLDVEGFSVVEFPARVLRVPPGGRQRFTPRVLAALVRAAGPARRAAGAVRAPTRLGDLQLPLLPPAEVVRLDALLAAADARRALAHREIDLLDEVCRVTTHGLTEGRLTLADVTLHHR